MTRSSVASVKERELAYNGHTLTKKGVCLEKEIIQGSTAGYRTCGRPKTHKIMHKIISDRTSNKCGRQTSVEIDRSSQPCNEDGWRQDKLDDRKHMFAHTLKHVGLITTNSHLRRRSRDFRRSVLTSYIGALPAVKPTGYRRDGDEVTLLRCHETSAVFVIG